MKTYKIVKVEWLDSGNYTGWNSHPEAAKFAPIRCVSCGILVKTAKGSIGVTHSLAADRDIAETMVISRKVIQKIEVLQKFRK